jgi:C4-dicarboxylate-specific signal transduction histidine kinase
VNGGVGEAGIAARRRSPTGQRALFQRSFLSARSRHTYSILILSIVLFMEGAVVLFVIQSLHNSYGEVVEIHERSVRGLWQMGEVQYEAQETRRATMYALTTINAHLQVNYADESREAERHVTEGIADFVARAQTSEERRVGQQLTKDWTSYLAVRNAVLALILEGSIKDAVDMDMASGAPQFERVRQDLEQVKRLYDAQASHRLAAVATFSGRSTLKLSLALGIGLLLGIIAVWFIQRSTVRAALQTASLQMEIVASVSHELRTPITAILSAGENFRDGLVEGEDSLKRHGLIITKQARQLKSLVDQVLVYATATKDKPWHDVRVLDVCDLIDDAISKVSLQLREAGFTVDREIEPDLPPVAGDISLLSHCLQNLIANAVKYSGQNRWVGISADLVGTGIGPNEVQIRVHDHGLGIAAADLAHVFEPFYRGRRAAEAQIRGSGLGLSIARRCAEVFGGRLTVVSTEGVGSVFTLHLPSAREPALVSETNKTNGRALS